MKHWIYKDTSVTAAAEFAERANIGDIFSYLLLNRGIDTVEEVRSFIYPNISHMHDPFLLTDMEKAVFRIKKAAQNHEKVTIYGDYDVDGLTSVTILSDALKSLGINAEIYIPDRLHEGYGLNNEAIKSIAGDGTTLIITVDLGATATDEVEYGNGLGLDFVITDHHQLGEKLPDAVAVVNPHREDCRYPYKELAGVGVAFKLASALLSDKFDYKSILVKYVDLLCLGTIADIVPLTGENRFYAKYGLTHFHETKNFGLKALIKYGGFENRQITETVIGFGIAPRINAAGRMGNAQEALNLLTAKSEADAEHFAQILCNLNDQRKLTEQEIFRQALAETEGSCDEYNVIVASGRGWHTGIIGIVASRLLDIYHKPVIVLSIDEHGMAHGSARSIENFFMFDALSSCGGLLEKFGGHDMAAGLTIKEENIPAFRAAINEIASIVLPEDAFRETLEIDYEAEVTEIDIGLAEKLKFFEPYGTDNPRPVFSMSNLTVVDSAPTKDGKHLRARLNCMGRHLWCIGFGMGDIHLTPGETVDIAFNLELNEYNGSKEENLILRDIHKHNEAKI